MLGSPFPTPVRSDVWPLPLHWAGRPGTQKDCSNCRARLLFIQAGQVCERSLTPDKHLPRASLPAVMVELSPLSLPCESFGAEPQGASSEVGSPLASRWG